MKRGDNLFFCPICGEPITKDVVGKTKDENGKPIKFVEPKFNPDFYEDNLYHYDINCVKCGIFFINDNALYEFKHNYYEIGYRDRLNPKRENKLRNKAKELYKKFDKCKSSKIPLRKFEITPEILKEVFEYYCM